MGIFEALVEDDKSKQAEMHRLYEAAIAYRDLATCYRIGKKPSEVLFARLKTADELLKLYE